MSTDKRDKLPDHWQKGAKTRGSNYSYKEKVTALGILEKNDFNYLKTSKILKVNVDTLRSWANKYGNDVFKSIEQATKDAAKTIAERKSKFLDLTYDAKELLILRLQELIPKEDKILTLATALDQLHKCTMTEMGEKTEDSLKPENIYFQLNQQIIQMSKDFNDGKKNKPSDNGN
jgi:hypothetical protein